MIPGISTPLGLSCSGISDESLLPFRSFCIANIINAPIATNAIIPTPIPIPAFAPVDKPVSSSLLGTVATAVLDSFPADKPVGVVVVDVLLLFDWEVVEIVELKDVVELTGPSVAAMTIGLVAQQSVLLPQHQFVVSAPLPLQGVT